MKDGLHVLKDRSGALLEATRQLTQQQVMVGVPGETNTRGRAAGEPTNASLAYIHDQGEPSMNIPARPFMAPGIARARAGVTEQLRAAGLAALDGNAQAVTARLSAAGLVAVASIQAVIRAGIAPPLAASTVAGRIRHRASSSWRKKRRAEVAANVAAGNAPGAGIFTPLIDTGALLASITYVIRKRGDR